MDVIYSSVFKPRRILYYIEPTPQQLEDFYAGKVPEILSAYNDTYGTYDCPGLFNIKQDGKRLEVLGIEFRPDDPCIKYPEGMKSVILKAGLMKSDRFTDCSSLTKEDIWKQINACLEYDKPIPYIVYKDIIKIEKDPSVIQIFTFNETIRYQISAEEISIDKAFISPIPETEKEKQLFDIAYKDFVTGHYNWNYLWPIISMYGFRGIQDFAFVHFDVKDYKAVNVVYGHGAANDVLRRITEKMNKTEWIYYSARCDNDNFAMMIKSMPDEETKEKLNEFFKELEVLPEDPKYHIYYRIGVVPMKATLQLGAIVADAGKQAQRLGNKKYETEIHFYTNQMFRELEWAERIKTYLDKAIERDEFLVYLQPKYDIRSEKIHGAEALIRWKFHGRDLLPPYKFIPVFEQGGLITKLDDIVLKKVCGLLKKWKEQKIPLYPISVNLSRTRLGDPDLIEHLTSIVDEYGVDHSLIDFELTESAAYDNQSVLISVIQSLKERGFKISLDDFGTGYSSLSLMSLIPMDTIKIDKSFVDGIATGQSDYKECTVLKHIISMSKDLNFTCLAEGAEKKEQVDLLRAFGCEIVQGYYYSKPLPADEYEDKLYIGKYEVIQ